jgi:dolichyl-phosphate beta-glucosyltransferase
LDGFSFDVEFLFVAQKRGLKIKEIPVKWKDVLPSRVNVVSDSIRLFFAVLRIYFNNKKGLYH